MYNTLDTLVRLLAPILAHTAEEAWVAIGCKSQDVPSVHLAATPRPMGIPVNTAMWDKVMALRDEVLKSLEDLRKNETIGSNQEASVHVTTNDDELLAYMQTLGAENFAALCIISEFKIEKGAETKIVAQKSPHQKCQRCWNYRSSVGQVTEYADLCSRCAAVIKG
jgi:isoleucyl-tRNA synthetase